jgi:uncharacterized protein (TIGR02117 family)
VKLAYQFIWVLVVFNSCSLAPFARDDSMSFSRGSCVEAPQDNDRAIHVVNLGWHTGIVISAASAPRTLRELLPEFDAAPWVEIGWGDSDFYRASGYSVWAGIRAAFFSRGAALHVSGIATPPAEYFRQAEVVELRISECGFDALVERVVDTVARDSAGRPITLGPSLYGSGHFYTATGDFSLWNSCNSWVARLLFAAGCEVKPDRIRASALMSDLASCCISQAQ